MVITGFDPYIYRFNPAGSYNPVPLNSSISVRVGGLSIDENGNYLTMGHLQIGAPWDIYEITPGGWSTIVAPDLYSLIPSAGSTFASFGIVAAAPDGDIYVG